MIEDMLKNQYALLCISLERSTVGAGSNTYFATCTNGKFVLKYPSISEINHPSNEPLLCNYLNHNGIPVSKFLKNKNGTYISQDENGCYFHVQEFVEGETYALNSAPDWLLRESARNLGKIHSALKDYAGLPIGIGEDFFRCMTAQKAAESYARSLATARECGDAESEDDLLYRIELMKRMPLYKFDLSKLTCQATHGDYFISQFICRENRINAIIDWTSACVHPVIWEIVRSYVYAAPECAAGIINDEKFGAYLEEYQKYAHLNAYDLDIMKELFFYQIAVCDYYGQYYLSTANNREIYLHQAKFSTRLMKNYF